jgi:hypothetical protein
VVTPTDGQELGPEGIHDSSSSSDPDSSSDPEVAPTSEHAFLEHQLIEVLQEVKALQELLGELPTIYEQKFQARLRNLRDEQVDLERNNQALRRRLLVLAPGSDPDLLPLPPRGLLAPAIRSALRLRP